MSGECFVYLHEVLGKNRCPQTPRCSVKPVNQIGDFACLAGGRRSYDAAVGEGSPYTGQDDAEGEEWASERAEVSDSAGSRSV